MDELQDAARQAWRKIRAEIERTILFHLSGEIDTRIFFRYGQLDVGIGLVVPEKNIEFRTVFLD